MTTYLTKTMGYRGYWGIGETEVEATQNCKDAGGRAPWIVRRIDDHWEDVHVDQIDGSIRAWFKDEFEHIPREDRPPIVAETTRVGARGKRETLYA
jgi:hypothetical protein